MTSLELLLLQALVIVTGPYLLSLLLRGSAVLPPVTLQVLTGIALGPSVLGLFAPHVSQALFPPESLRPLNHIATLALVLFGFTTGMHLDWASLRERLAALAMIWGASLLAPAALGLAASWWLLRCCSPQLAAAVTHWQFAAGIMICCAVTALPVLAAILREMGLQHTRVGQMALAIAAGTDCVLWLVLSAVLALGGTAGHLQPLQLATPGVLLLCWFSLRKLLKWVLNISGEQRGDAAAFERGMLVLACTCALGCSLVAEYGGVHYLLGSFVAGAAVPTELRTRLLQRIEPITLAVLMPFFFMLTGLKTMIDISSPVFVSAFAVITGATLLGKMGGVVLAARATRESWPTGFALGALVQTKGLMEVVVASVFLDSGIFGRVAFSAVVAMAVSCTCLTAPVVRMALRQREPVVVDETKVARVG